MIFIWFSSENSYRKTTEYYLIVADFVDLVHDTQITNLSIIAFVFGVIKMLCVILYLRGE